MPNASSGPTNTKPDNRLSSNTHPPACQASRAITVERNQQHKPQAKLRPGAARKSLQPAFNQPNGARGGSSRHGATNGFGSVSMAAIMLETAADFQLLRALAHERGPRRNAACQLRGSMVIRSI
jgi:hypothetical protein